MLLESITSTDLSTNNHQVPDMLRQELPKHSLTRKRVEERGLEIWYRQLGLATQQDSPTTWRGSSKRAWSYREKIVKVSKLSK